MSEPRRTEWVELPPAVIRRALDGDRAAFTRLYRHYLGVVRGAVAARVRRWPTLTRHMDDVLGDVWVQMLADDRRVLRHYDPERGSFGYFIRLVAATRAASVIRQHVRREAQAPAVTPGVEEEIERVLLQRDFLEALWARAQPLLKEVDRELFVQVMVMGRETQRVASELGMGRDAAYQRIARLRTRLVRLATQLLTEDQGVRARSSEIISAVVMQALLLTLASDASQTDHASADPTSAGALHERRGS